jgi:hypothetical protein
MTLYFKRLAYKNSAIMFGLFFLVVDDESGALVHHQPMGLCRQLFFGFCLCFVLLIGCGRCTSNVRFIKEGLDGSCDFFYSPPYLYYKWVGMLEVLLLFQLPIPIYKTPIFQHDSSITANNPFMCGR